MVEKGFIVFHVLKTITTLILEKSHITVKSATKLIVIAQPLGDTLQFILERHPTNVTCVEKDSLSSMS